MFAASQPANYSSDFGSASNRTQVSGSRQGAGSYSSNVFKGYTKPAVKSGTTYSVGDMVLHKVFGKGMIMKTQKMGNDVMLEIAFDKAGTKTLMANFCKMEKI